MNIKEIPYRYKVFASLIPVGRENAEKLEDIMKLADVNDRRVAHEIVESLITEYGFVILASRRGKRKGYFIPTCEDEFRENIKPFSQTIMSMQKRELALRTNFYKA